MTLNTAILLRTLTGKLYLYTSSQQRTDKIYSNVSGTSWPLQIQMDISSPKTTTECGERLDLTMVESYIAKELMQTETGVSTGMRVVHPTTSAQTLTMVHPPFLSPKMLLFVITFLQEKITLSSTTPFTVTAS